MRNVIAVIWDFDNTLTNGYMETPILTDNGIDPKAFWQEVRELPKKYLDEQGIRVNPDTIYLNHLIHYAKSGKLAELNNEKLRAYGKRLNFFAGIPDIFSRLRDTVEQNPIYQEYDIRVEHYIVSAGLAEVIRGSLAAPYVQGIWGCELIDTPDADGNLTIGEVGYAIDHTTKTRALFEINKGVGKIPSISVNTTVPSEARRVPFSHMVYIADGPSDIPVFSILNQRGGATFAVYPPQNLPAMQQVEQMRMDGRIQMFAEANYSEGTTADLWLTNKVQQIAETIRKEQRAKIETLAAHGDPQHLV